MTEFVRVTFPGVEGTPLVPARRAARMVERGWSVVESDDDTEAADPPDDAAPSAPALPHESADNQSPEKPDSRAESNINKEL